MAGAVEVHPRAEPVPVPDADDLRTRMRLRLAMNQSAAARGATSPSGVESSTTGATQAGHSDVSQMVWNSVMESLSTSTALFQLANAEPRQPEPPPVAHPSPPPVFVPQPLYAEPSTSSLSDQQAIAGLFAPGARPQFAGLPAPAGPPIARAFDDLGVMTPQPVLVAGPGPSSAPTTAANGLPAMIVPAMPVIAPPVRSAPAPRPNHMRAGEGLPTLTPRATTKKKKRRPFRVLFSLLLVLALLAGAGYAGWYVFLKSKVTWAGDVKPLATFVEKTVHRTFISNIAVVTLSAPEYEVKLGIEVLARTYAGADGSLSALNAVGIVNGVPEPSVIGHLVATTVTSFYHPSDKTIYRVLGSTAVYEVSMLKALTVALADQSVQWSKQWPTLNDSQRVGYSALIDGVGERVVLARFKTKPDLEGAGLSAKDYPVYLSSVIGSVEIGGSRFPTAPETDLMKDLAAPPNDAAVFDLARTTPKSPVVVPPVSSGGEKPRELGMQFWFETMLPVLGADGARAAALLWDGDSSVTAVVNGQACLRSNIVAASPEAQAALATALGQWGGKRPASSIAAVTSEPANVVAVFVCAPAEATQEPAPADGGAQLYSAARKERIFADQLILLGLPATASSRSCAVTAFRGGSAANFQDGSTDPEVITAMNDVISFCKGA